MIKTNSIVRFLFTSNLAAAIRNRILIAYIFEISQRIQIFKHACNMSAESYNFFSKCYIFKAILAFNAFCYWQKSFIIKRNFKKMKTYLALNFLARLAYVRLFCQCQGPHERPLANSSKASIQKMVAIWHYIT